MPPPQVYQVTKFDYGNQYNSNHFIQMGLNTFSLSGAINVYTNDTPDYSQGLDIRNKENVDMNSNYDYVVNEFMLNGVVSNFKTYIFNIIKNIGSVGASGIVAVNCLNPFSVLAAICGTGSAPLSVQSNHNNQNYSIYNLAANYSMSFTPASPFDNSVFTYSYEQADHAWGVALVWTAIMIGFVGLIIMSYMRKDFK